MIRSKLGQRIMGVVMMILGGAATAWTWYEAIHSGYYYRVAVVLFPVFAVSGLGALLFPIDMDEFEAEHGTGRPVSLTQLPPLWRGIAVVAIGAGLANWYAVWRYAAGR